MTTEAIETIRKRWLSAWSAVPLSTDQRAQAAADIAQLLAEVERLQFSCDQITRQYARLCEGCASKHCTLASLPSNKLSSSTPPR